MAKRTQIVCLSEGKKGESIDPVFINRLIRSLAPKWIRPFKGSNLVRCIPCGGRKDVIARMPVELKACLKIGGQTTLMVWADLDDNMSDGEQLKATFWETAEAAGINQEQFAKVVFVFAKYRLENWIQYINDGATDESVKGPRVKNRIAADAAKKLADRCKQTQTQPALPPSLEWSCQNWHRLVKLMSS